MKSAVISVVLSLLGGLTGFEPTLLFAQQSSANPSPHVKVIIVSGQNGANVLSKQSAVQPVVEVLDNNNKPLAGALVRFTAPRSGPTVRFPNDQDTLTVVADLKGVATATGMVPVGTGSFRVDVTAEYDDEMATAQLSQTNYPSVTLSGQPAMSNALTTSRENHHGLSRGAKVGILVAVVAAAAAGIAVGLHGGSKKTGTTVGVGTPTVGAP